MAEGDSVLDIHNFSSLIQNGSSYCWAFYSWLPIRIVSDWTTAKPKDRRALNLHLHAPRLRVGPISSSSTSLRSYFTWILHLNFTKKMQSVYKHVKRHRRNRRSRLCRTPPLSSTCSYIYGCSLIAVSASTALPSGPVL